MNHQDTIIDETGKLGEAFDAIIKLSDNPEVIHAATLMLQSATEIAKVAQHQFDLIKAYQVKESCN